MLSKRVSINEGKVRCYIYGSTHIRIPREDILREWLSRVDYVLIEGLSTRDWRSLIKQRPSAILIVLGVLTCFFLFHDMPAWIMDKWYRLKGKPPFKGDMSYVRDYAVKLGKKVELADASLCEVLSEQSVNLKHSLRVCNMGATLLIVVFIALVISSLYSNLPPTILISISISIIFIPITILLICAVVFVGDINEFRDSKVVKRTKELVEMGYSVLIVRGKRHIKFISSELRKHSIICEVYTS